jgi:hypothetical protein
MRRRHDDSGNAAAELVVLTPVVCLCAVFVFWCGRLGQARSQIDLAAERGARAASMVRRSRMVEVGRTAALDSLRNNGVVCTTVEARVDVLQDSVAITVRCSTESRGVWPFDSRSVSAVAVSPIDRYRAQ